MTREVELLLDVQRILSEYTDIDNPHLAITIVRYIEHREAADQLTKTDACREGVQAERERWKKAVDDFNRLPDREKWNTWGLQEDTFVCRHCKSPSQPERCSPFPGVTKCCGECDETLSRRTGGGQNDPFGWVLKAKMEDV